MVIYRKKKKKRKKKIIPMKMVRINDKTEIEVDARIPDEVAKEEYLERLKLSKSKTDGRFRRQ